MSVVGLDVGNDTSCVALARKRGIDVLMNKESKRETPAVVNFGDKMRYIGTDGAAKFSLSPQNTVHQLKRLVGKKFADPQLQADIAKLPFSVTEGPDGGCLINVTYCNEPASFSPEQVLAMVLVDLKHIVEVEAGTAVTDCVLAVPTYFTEPERYAMLNAASIAGLNCLRLINENTATALAYGIYKTDLPDTEAVNVAFVDVGHSATQVSIVQLKRSGLVIKSHAWDRNLGGRDVDELLCDHFADEFKKKFKIDIKSNKKASFKLRVAVEKLKKMLSANAEAPINIECIMEDTDVRGMMTRDELETICAPLFARMRAPIDQALAEAGLKPEDISSVEIVGSSTRIPAVARVVEEAFKRPPSRTMNSKECVSRGCALQCAMLSPVFKVREFGVEDACPYAVELRWDKDGETVSQVLFERNSTVPATKMLTFMRSEPFKVTARVPELDLTLGECQIGPFEVPAGQEKAKLKVKVRMNLHGLTTVEGADNFIEVEEEAPKDVPMEDTATAAASGDAAAAPMDTDVAEASGAEKKAGDKKKKTKKQEVPLKATLIGGLSQKQLELYFEREGQLQAADRLQEETNERKNALEAYVYSIRNRMYDSLAPYIKESDKEKLSATLQAMEDWLYEEGEDTTKSVYIAKLEELKKTGVPIETRAVEDQTRGPAAQALRQTAEYYLSFARNDSLQYAHITPAERETVAKEAQSALTWLGEKEALQSKLAKWEEPVLLTSDVTKKRDTLERVCKPIASRPAPKPEAPKPEPAPAAGAEDAAPADGAAPMEAETPAAEQPMEQ